jgi:outer membrane protein, heavy metal efflux system
LTIRTQHNFRILDGASKTRLSQKVFSPGISLTFPAIIEPSLPAEAIAMNLRPQLPFLLVLLTAALMASPAAAQTGPAPGEASMGMTMSDVLAHARENRQEIAALEAQADAVSRRQDIVAALEQPMLTFTVDHLPLGLHGVDANLMVSQSFPLSAERRHRRDQAYWQWRQAQARTVQAELGILEEAAMSFLMLWEREQSAEILDRQVDLASQLVAVTTARYASGVGSQADVLRAETELVRLEAGRQALQAQIQAARAMLNMSLGRQADAPLGPALHEPPEGPPPDLATVRRVALETRPELVMGDAEIEAARADLEVMRSMYWPMAMVGAGPAYTMADGWGVMAMVGLNLPLQRRSLRAGVSQAQAMELMARADRRAMEIMVDGAAAAAREEVVAARIFLTALDEEVLPRARQSVDAALASYGAGQGSFVTVIEAVASLFALENETLRARLSLSAAWIRLYQAMGTWEAL